MVTVIHVNGISRVLLLIALLDIPWIFYAFLDLIGFLKRKIGWYNFYFVLIHDY